MAKHIAIMSGKGGVGKTLLSAAFGKVLADEKKKCLLIDLDFGLRGLDFYTAVADRVFYSILDVLQEACTLNDAILWIDENVAYLSAGWMKEPKKAEWNQFPVLLETADNLFDYIIFDCPSGNGKTIEYAGKNAEILIFVTDGTLAGIRAVDKVRGNFSRNRFKKLWILLNRYQAEGKRFIMFPEEIQELLPVDLLGVIPEADELQRVCEMGELFYMQNDRREDLEVLNILSEVLKKLDAYDSDTENSYSDIIPGYKLPDENLPEDPIPETKANEEPVFAEEDLNTETADQDSSVPVTDADEDPAEQPAHKLLEDGESEDGPCEGMTEEVTSLEEESYIESASEEDVIEAEETEAVSSTEETLEITETVSVFEQEDSMTETESKQSTNLLDMLKKVLFGL